MTRRIRQREGLDCGVATLAMACGVSYEQSYCTVGDLYDPMEGMSDIMEALELFGYTWGGDDPDIMDMGRGILAPEFFRTFVWGRRAILFLPSTRFTMRGGHRVQGAWHFVYYDGERLLDPNPSRSYRHTSLDTCYPEYMILFKETGDEDSRYPARSASEEFEAAYAEAIARRDERLRADLGDDGLAGEQPPFTTVHSLDAGARGETSQAPASGASEADPGVGGPAGLDHDRALDPVAPS